MKNKCLIYICYPLFHLVLTMRYFTLNGITKKWFDICFIHYTMKFRFTMIDKPIYLE